MTYENIYWLKVQPAENQLEYLVEVLGYKGVLIVVTSTKQLDNCGRSCYAQHYAYLPDPEWSEVGTEMGLLVERVIASLQETS